METNKPGTNAASTEVNEVTDYLSDIRHIEMEGYEQGIRKARNSLFWAAGLLFFWEMIALIRAGEFEPISFGFAVVIAGIFIALGLWTKKKPYTAIITGIVVFIAHWLLAIVFNGMAYGAEGVGKAIIGGIIIRIIIMVNLIRSLQDAKELQAGQAD
jgi:energy-coupling factor transporter transmembrane protein EcfT